MRSSAAPSGGAWPASRRSQQQQDHGRDRQRPQDPVAARRGDAAEDAVGEEDEEAEQEENVEHPLGDQGPEHAAQGCSRANRLQVGADRVPGPRRQHAVAHVADGRQRVGVGAVRAGAVVAEDSPPALAPQHHPAGVDGERREQGLDSLRGIGKLGRLLVRGPDDDGGE